MQPCIFLDIDGVIQPSRSQNTYQLDYTLPDKLAKDLNKPKIASLNTYLVNQIYACFSKQSIQLLYQLIQQFNARIVITSSWRILYSIEELKTMFDIFDLGSYIIGATKIISPRTQAIQDYIDAHHIDSYIVLDDFDMSSAFNFHFIYIHNHFKKEDYEKAKYAFEIQKRGG